MRNRAPTNIPKVKPMLWSKTPSNIIEQPIITPVRLPRISAVYGTIGMARIEPTDIMAFRRPRLEADGL